jgi:arylsulfatase A-like enzyme
MNRRSFLCGLPGLASLSAFSDRALKTEHLVFIVNGDGVRKREYYEDASLSPNIRRLAREGFVFEQDHCEQVTSHDAAFAELVRNLEYHAVDSITSIPQTLRRIRPRVVVCRQAGHDVGHQSYEQYLAAVRSTDDAIGRVFDWISGDPDFASKTAIVIRPEFGRDDEVNQHGQLHHSYGFYYTHRVASIFWGPDFNRGVDRTTIINARDMAPTLAKLFGVDAIHAEGRAFPGLFKI